MTLLVVVILAVMWALVLLPPFVRSRSSGRPGDSVSSFGRQLSTLSRTAGRGARRQPTGAAYQPPPSRSYQPAPTRAARPSYAPVAYADDDGYRYDDGYGDDYGYGDPRDDVRGHSSAPTYRVAPPRRPAPVRRTRMSRNAAKRRRQNVLMILGALAIATLALGLGVPGLGVLLLVNVAIDVALVAYIVLLVQLRKVEVQRSSRFAWSHAA